LSCYAQSHSSKYATPLIRLNAIQPPWRGRNLRREAVDTLFVSFPSRQIGPPQSRLTSAGGFGRGLIPCVISLASVTLCSLTIEPALAATSFCWRGLPFCATPVRRFIRGAILSSAITGPKKRKLGFSVCSSCRPGRSRYPAGAIFAAQPQFNRLRFVLRSWRFAGSVVSCPA